MYFRGSDISTHPHTNGTRVYTSDYNTLPDTNMEPNLDACAETPLDDLSDPLCISILDTSSSASRTLDSIESIRFHGRSDLSNLSSLCPRLRTLCDNNRASDTTYPSDPSGLGPTSSPELEATSLELSPVDWSDVRYKLRVVNKAEDDVIYFQTVSEHNEDALSLLQLGQVADTSLAIQMSACRMGFRGRASSREVFFYVRAVLHRFRT